LQASPQVSGQGRMSASGSATMLEVPAGVAQQAEQPSCKQLVEVPVTRPVVLR